MRVCDENKSMSDLLPCPFCGSSHVALKSKGAPRETYVACIECDRCYCGGPFGRTAQQARDNWNLRSWVPAQSGHLSTGEKL